MREISRLLLPGGCRGRMHAHSDRRGTEGREMVLALVVRSSGIQAQHAFRFAEPAAKGVIYAQKTVLWAGV